MIHGSCLCGAVAYSVAGPVSDVVHCHCESCRKAHGSAFGSVVSVPVDAFSLAGAEHLSRFESSPGKWRHFCRHCGTHIYARRDRKENVAISLGTLDSDLPSREFARIWLSDRANWYDPDADLPRYDRSWRDGRPTNR